MHHNFVGKQYNFIPIVWVGRVARVSASWPPLSAGGEFSQPLVLNPDIKGNTIDFVDKEGGGGQKFKKCVNVTYGSPRTQKWNEWTIDDVL